MDGSRKRRARRRLPPIDWKGVGIAATMLLGWWDARTKPDPRTAAVASLAVSGAETDVALADSIRALRMEIAAIKNRLGRGERGKARDTHGGTSHASPAPAQRGGITGWLSRWLGNRP